MASSSSAMRTRGQRLVLAIVDQHGASVLGPRSDMAANTVHAGAARVLVREGVLQECAGGPGARPFVRRPDPQVELGLEAGNARVDVWTDSGAEGVELVITAPQAFASVSGDTVQVRVALATDSSCQLAGEIVAALIQKGR